MTSARQAAEMRTYAVRRRGDVVPSAPSAWMGYGDYLEQFACSGHDWRARDAGTGVLDRLAVRLLNANAYDRHMIEGYKRDLL